VDSFGNGLIDAETLLDEDGLLLLFSLFIVCIIFFSDAETLLNEDEDWFHSI
jgi:hypothetical protein